MKNRIQLTAADKVKMLPKRRKEQHLSDHKSLEDDSGWSSILVQW